MNRVLIRGNSCFPLSPRVAKDADDKNSNESRNTISRQDQLLLTFKLLGNQTEDDLSFLTEKNTLEYA